MKNGIEGEVIEALRDARFRVEFAPGKIVMCYLAGKMRINNINVLVGDKVLAVVEPDGSIGRIIRRI
jgi:translation initiation factor IF-1